MNYENTEHAQNAQTAPIPAVETRFSFDTIKRWMMTEVNLRLARGWLVAASALVVLLALIAID